MYANTSYMHDTHVESVLGNRKYKYSFEQQGGVAHRATDGREDLHSKRNSVNFSHAVTERDSDFLTTTTQESVEQIVLLYRSISYSTVLTY